MTGLIVGSLKGIAFDYFRALPIESIMSLVDLEARFLVHFYEDDTKVSMPILIRQK